MEPQINMKSKKSLEEVLEELAPRLHQKGSVRVSKSRDAGPVDLYYEIYGSGEKKIMFVMGLHGTHLMWSLQADFFTSLKDYQVCIFDNRGIGKSTYNIGLLTTKALAMDALELLKHLGWEQNITLVGLSLGGMIVQKMALIRPKIFKNLILCSTYFSSLSAKPTKVDCLLMLNYLYSIDFNKVLIKSCFPKNYLHEISDQEFSNYDLLRKALVKIENRCPKQTFTSQIAQLGSALVHVIFPEEFELYKKHNINTIVIHGTKDKIIPFKSGIKLSKHLNCTFVMFKNSGHLLNLERSVEFNVLIKDFVEKNHFDSKFYMDKILFFKPLNNNEDISHSDTNASDKPKNKSIISLAKQYLAVEVSIVDSISERNSDILSRLSLDKVQSLLG